MAARKSITRGKRTFRVKFPSPKNKGMVYCESILESHTALYLEICPYVKRYEAQPSVEVYYDPAGNQHLYYPDFRAVLEDDSEIDIESKPEARLRNLDIKTKLVAVHQRYEELGRRFRILTENHVRKEPLFSNLKLVYASARVPIDGNLLSSLKLRLQEAQFDTVGEAARILGGQQHVRRLLAQGYLMTHFLKPIHSGSHIWLAEKGGYDAALHI